MTTTWWRFRLKADKPDEIVFELGALGAQGIESKSETVIEAYFVGPQSNHAFMTKTLKSLNVEVLSIEQVQDINWSAKCKELWDPVEIGNIKVIPLHQSVALDKTNPNELFIIPGTGFGTGHHASTALILELIQSDEIVRSQAKQICDLGTGSGILAIQLAKQFPYSQITALDIDQLALDNAKENVRLNNKESQISLSTQPFPTISSQFDLIVANLYAEMLCSLGSELIGHTKNGGYIIVSGIMDQLWEEVRTTFCSASSQECSLVSKVSRNDWSAGIFRKEGRVK